MDIYRYALFLTRKLPDASLASHSSAWAWCGCASECSARSIRRLILLASAIALTPTVASRPSVGDTSYRLEFLCKAPGITLTFHLTPTADCFSANEVARSHKD